MFNKFKKGLPFFIMVLSFSYLSAEEELCAIEEKTTEEIYTQIYETKAWGVDAEGNGTSGLGAQVTTTKEFREFLQDFMNTHSVKTVVDLGCGYWEYMKTVNWDEIQYFGYDAVQKVVDVNSSNHSLPTVSFIYGDALKAELPKADLLICKDVMQHMTIEEIQVILAKAANYKYCLFVNDVVISPDFTNEQIVNGEYRPLDLSKEPFNLKGSGVLLYNTGFTVKQVYLLENQ